MLIRLFGVGKVSAGDFAMLFTINMLVVESLWKMSNELRTFSDNWGAVSQTLKMIDQTIEVQDMPGAKEMVIRNGMICFDQVSFRHQGMSGELFKNTSVEIRSGQKVGLVGYSGSGKSSFVNLILRLFDVSSGRIMIDGQNIQEVTQDSLRKNIAIIPQDPSLFHRSLLENIRYSRPEATDEEVIAASKKACAHDFIIELANGYHTLVGERGIKLSGGQRQRIAIARAILKDAPILILDEATSALDSVTENLIQESLENFMELKTALVISHRLSTLSRMDRILVFENGSIVQDGTHSILLEQSGPYKQLWNTQMNGLLPEQRENDSLVEVFQL
jgi:ATP-binding cassette subfamily B protein